MPRLMFWNSVTSAYEELLVAGPPGFIAQDDEPAPGFFWIDTDAEPTNGVSKVLQVVNYQTGEVATGSTPLPFDDTVPQNTEGTEFITLAITPISATSMLLIDVVLHLSGNVAGAAIAAAIFQDSTAGALSVAASYVTNSTAWIMLPFRHKMTAGTTSATTFKVRAGMSAAGTITLNGQTGGRTYGGVLASSITITEIAA